jgi:hypothetical protein
MDSTDLWVQDAPGGDWAAVALFLVSVVVPVQAV